jgi:large-conductance mechanosensitive channel
VQASNYVIIAFFIFLIVLRAAEKAEKKSCCCSMDQHKEGIDSDKRFIEKKINFRYVLYILIYMDSFSG